MNKICALPETTSWLRPAVADDDPAFQSERIFPKTTLGQCLPSFDVVDDVIAAVKIYFVVKKGQLFSS